MTMSIAERFERWSFIDDNGTFRWKDPLYINELYFPLCNEEGIMSSITPMLHGDSKTGQHNFLLLPVSVEDLHNTKSARNFWFYIHGKGAWSASGNSCVQNAKRFTGRDSSQRTVEAGLLWHKVVYRDADAGLKAEILSFVPCRDDKAEIMHVKLTNQRDTEIKVTPTCAIPVYGRSAENIRDHRHVTSLVNRVEKHEYGIVVKPEIIFDERGHRMNETVYYVLGCEAEGEAPSGVIPAVSSFIGDGGSFEWPEAVVRNIPPEVFEGVSADGRECPGAIRFKDAVLQAGASKEYIVVIGVSGCRNDIEKLFRKYNSSGKISAALEENKGFWLEKTGKNTFESGLKRGFVNEAYEVFESLYGLCMNTGNAKIYPGIPEYFSADGKGMYHYLTGSASWLMLTVLNEMYGIRGELGQLVIQPKLKPVQFDSSGRMSAKTVFAGSTLTVEYINNGFAEYDDYRILSAEMNETDISRYISNVKTVKIPLTAPVFRSGAVDEEGRILRVELGV